MWPRARASAVELTTLWHVACLPLCVLVELDEQRFQVGEAVLPELRLPVPLDVADSVADRVRGLLAPVGKGDALRSAVAGVG